MTEKFMSEYNDRQYRLMAERIAQFEQEKIGLGHLIADLDALLCALQNADSHWKSAFHKQWAVLEEVRAVALDRGLKQLPKDYWNLVDNAIEKMKQLLARVNSEKPEAEA